MVVKVPHIPIAGETVMGSDFMIMPGGKGANQAVSAVAEIAYSKGIPFLLNPAPATVIPEDLFEKITILTPNETEASILTSKEKVKKK